jgi:hypothetical protein
MFCTPGLVFGGTEGVRSLCSFGGVGTRCRRYRGRRVPFSCFALPDSLSTVPRVAGPVFMFCVPGLVFCGTEGVGSRFNVLHARNSFGGTEGVRSHFNVLRTRTRFRRNRGRRSLFHVLRSRTHFRRYRGQRVPFSCFACPDSFFAVPRASGPVFMFSALGLVFGGTECVGSRFHVLRARTSFRQY